MIIQGVDQRKAVEFVGDKYLHLKEYRRAKEQAWMECYRAYFSNFNRQWDLVTKETKRSRRYIAIPFDQAEGIQSQLSGLMFAGSDWMQPYPLVRGKLEHDDESAKEIRQVHLHQFHNMDFYRKNALLLKHLAICGNCPWTMSWRMDYTTDYPAYAKATEEWQAKSQQYWQQYQAAQSQHQMALQQAQQTGSPPPPPPSVVMPEPPQALKEVAYSGPSLEIGDIFNFVVDPFSPDPRHQLKIKRTFVSKSVLQRLAQRDQYGYSVYENVDAIEGTGNTSPGDYYDDFTQERYHAFGLQVPDSSQVELHEAWGTIELPGMYGGENQTYVSYVAAVAEGKNLIRFEPTFLWSGDSPTQLATYRDTPGQVYGIGGLESELGGFDLVNVRANQIIDCVAYILNPEHKCREDGIIDLKASSAPGKRHIMGDPANNMIPLEKNFTGVEIGMRDLEFLKQDVTSRIMGGGASGANPRTSATRDSLDAQSNAGKIGDIARHIEESVIAKQLDIMGQLNIQYLSVQEAQKILQKADVSFLKSSPESVRRHWLFKVRGSRQALDKQKQIQDLMMYVQFVASNPVMMSIIDLNPLSKKLYEMLEIGAPEEVFRDEETANQVLQTMIQMGLLGNDPQRNAQEIGAESIGGPVRNGAESGTANSEYGPEGPQGGSPVGVQQPGLPPAGQQNPLSVVR